MWEVRPLFHTLYTPAGEQLIRRQQDPWQGYPRPQLRRDSFLSLNGRWQFAVGDAPDLPARYDREILVPFCPESPLSGIHRHFPEGSYLFYRRVFALPAGFCKGRVLLHIGAADQVLDCFCNGVHLGSHTGGYTAMTFDLTDVLEQTNRLELRVRDDLRTPVLPYGKQVMERGGMWYTPVSGIWQSVWLESVPEHFISALTIHTDTVRALVDTGDASLTGTVTVQTPEGPLTCPLTGGRAEIAPPHPRLWSPENPYLYRFTVQAGADRVESYFALRQISVRQVGGHARLCLNGQPYFFHGVLDQGYWSDGLYTPADPACYAQDIRTMKALGFNTLRKHIKVEPEEFYYQCDCQGMVVMQDMVNTGDYAYWRDTVWPTVGFQTRRDDRNLHPDPAARAAFVRCMEQTVRQLYSHPCILFWTIFNEGWGQFDSSALYARLRALDPDRIIDTTSGWFRGGDTDVDSIHHYYGPWRLKAGRRPLLLSEFGGCCLAVEGHLFHPDKTYGYSTSLSPAGLTEAILTLYRRRVLPAVAKGLCGAIYTQLSDVEDEINGLVTYDRRVLKPDAGALRALAGELTRAMAEATRPAPETAEKEASRHAK